MFNDPFFSHEIVQIPLHFFSSKQPQKPSQLTNQSSAVKLQSLFRGFLVRKNVNNISLIRNQVCEVETNIKHNNIIKLMRTDVKERLRVNEILMLLLLKLDSIRGVDFGVREFRKCVIRKVIQLQEVLDSVADYDMIRFDETVETDCETVTECIVDTDCVNVVDSVGLGETFETDCGIVTEHVTDHTVCVKNVDDIVDVIVDNVNVMDSVVNDVTVRSGEIVSEQVTDTDCVIVEDVRVVDINVNDVTVRVGETVETECETITEQVTETDRVMNVGSLNDVIVDNVNVVDSAVNDTVRSCETVETDCETVTEQITEHVDCVMNVDGLIDVKEDSVKEIDVNCDSVGVLGEGMDDRKRSVALVEKLMDDNEKMTTLMTQMFERDEMQTRMINSLSRRVERLEKRFKPRKKKKIMMHSA